MKKRLNRVIISGNAKKEGKDKRGWFVGAFLEKAGPLRKNEAIEVKWGTHPRGEKRESKAEKGMATSLSILTKGQMGFTFEGKKETVLSEEGDYLMWQPNIPHSTISYKDSVVITIRWPSLSSKKN